MNQPHTPSPHFASFPTGLPNYLFKVLFFIAPPQYHEPSISFTISFPLCKFPFISPTSYRNPPMGPPPSTSSPRKLRPNWPNHITLGHPFLYLYTHPKLFFIYLVHCKNPLFPAFTSPFVATFDDLLPFFGKRKPCHPWLGYSLSSTPVDIVHILRVSHRPLTSAL
jgi:hypothetical protein